MILEGRKFWPSILYQFLTLGWKDCGSCNIRKVPEYDLSPITGLPVCHSHFAIRTSSTYRLSYVMLWEIGIWQNDYCDRNFGCFSLFHNFIMFGLGQAPFLNQLDRQLKAMVFGTKKYACLSCRSNLILFSFIHFYTTSDSNANKGFCDISSKMNLPDKI